MTNTELIYNALKAPNVEGLEDIDCCCMICGKQIKRGLKYKNVLSSNFTNWGDCKDRASNYICKECTAVLKSREVRVNSFIADKGGKISEN